MSTLIRWNPFREMDDLQNRLTSIFGLSPLRTGLSPLRSEEGREESMAVTEWTPLVDITEDDSEYLIKLDIPEVKKDAVKVAVEGRVLTITGERKFEKEDKTKKYHRVERAYGNFLRSFTLPDDAEAAKVSAQFKDGVLTVRIAKSEHAKPKTIEVKVA